MATRSGGDGAGELPEFKLDARGRNVFIGLMLGMLVSSISQTIVGPAIPRIVAELGGMEHYSWLATTAMLVSAVSVPIVGKLSDLYGRRAFYLGGLAVFMLGSVLSGLAQNFWFLVFARAVQGLGMGTLMPLSQTIIGDIIPPRFRGKYQGLMGATFGFSSIVGPLAGGYITDTWGWRWLFYVSLPVGLAAFVFMAKFFHLDQEVRRAKIDFAGIATLTVGLVTGLLGTSLGGTTFPWASVPIIGLFTASIVALVAFVFVERKAEEPVIPLRLFRSSIFTYSNISNLAVSMMMFGVMIYAPVYAQGVLGMSAGESGAVLVPMSAVMILTSIGVGILITKWGKYKAFTILGIVIMGVGMALIARLGASSSALDLALATALFGFGLGMCMQVFTLIVQNVVMRRDLGVATATTQFFRSTGATVGIAIFGTILSSRMGPAIAAHMPPGAAPAGASDIDAGSVLDPNALAGLPPQVAQAIRLGLSDALHDLFIAGVPLAFIALLAAAMIKVVPLRTTLQSAKDGGREMLDTMSQTSGLDKVVPLPRAAGASRTRERVLGVKIALLARHAGLPDRDLLTRAVANVGNGDVERGRAILETASLMLLSENDDEITRAESSAAALADLADRPGGLLGDQLASELAVAVSRMDAHHTLTTVEPTVAERCEGVDFVKLRQAVDEVNAALLVDLAVARGAGDTGPLRVVRDEQRRRNEAQDAAAAADAASEALRANGDGTAGAHRTRGAPGDRGD
ncbi:MAG: MDR family MFS transporter [Dermatophilus congolensis]|nr:MDR family MFS transporter [Dermatophilus congolensis]